MAKSARNGNKEMGKKEISRQKMQNFLTHSLDESMGICQLPVGQEEWAEDRLKCYFYSFSSSNTIVQSPGETGHARSPASMQKFRNIPFLFLERKPSLRWTKRNDLHPPNISSRLCNPLRSSQHQGNDAKFPVTTFAAH